MARSTATEPGRLQTFKFDVQGACFNIKDVGSRSIIPITVAESDCGGQLFLRATRPRQTGWQLCYLQLRRSLGPKRRESVYGWRLEKSNRQFAIDIEVSRGLKDRRTASAPGDAVGGRMADSARNELEQRNFRERLPEGPGREVLLSQSSRCPPRSENAALSRLRARKANSRHCRRCGQRNHI